MMDIEVPSSQTPRSITSASTRRLLLGCLLLGLIAAPARTLSLDDLSFFWDEETSAMAAHSVIDGGTPSMPTGMEYRRALPVSYVTAVSARIFGTRDESAYRLPSAILGTLTVVLFFLIGRRWTGDILVATVAALMTGLGTWHLVYSRMNRMYAPLLFFFLASAYLLWRWASTGRRRHLFSGLATLAVAASIHLVAITALFFMFVPLLCEAENQARTPHSDSERGKPGILAVLATSSVAAGAIWLYHEQYVSAPYARSLQTPGDGLALFTGGVSTALSDGSLNGWPLGVSLLVGATLGVAVLRRGAGHLTGEQSSGDPGKSRDSALHPGQSPGTLLRIGVLYFGAAVGGALAFAGEIYGTVLTGAIVLLLWGEHSFRWRRARALLAACAIAATAIVGWDILQSGVVEGLRGAIDFPFPYLGNFLLRAPGAAVLFLGTVGWLVYAERPAPAGDYWPGERGIRTSALFVLVYLAALGIVRFWAPMRYYFPVFPFFDLVAAGGLVVLSRRVTRGTGAPSNGAAAVAVITVFSGILGGRGVPQAVATVEQEHGRPPDTYYSRNLPFRTDHRGAGKFLARRMERADVLVAEDPLQQHWYAGPVDYWLRDFSDARAFLYRDSAGVLRDIYVGSEHLSDPSELDSLAAEGDERIWVVTSGETHGNREHFLSGRQRRWLDSLQRSTEPAFIGADSVTTVYCLDCDGQADSKRHRIRDER